MTTVLKNATCKNRHFSGRKCVVPCLLQAIYISICPRLFNYSGSMGEKQRLYTLKKNFPSFLSRVFYKGQAIFGCSQNGRTNKNMRCSHYGRTELLLQSVFAIRANCFVLFLVLFVSCFVLCFVCYVLFSKASKP